jgi:uncharacterized protein YqhQ
MHQHGSSNQPQSDPPQTRFSLPIVMLQQLLPLIRGVTALLPQKYLILRNLIMTHSAYHIDAASPEKIKVEIKHKL